MPFTPEQIEAAYIAFRDRVGDLPEFSALSEAERAGFVRAAAAFTGTPVSTFEECLAGAVKPPAETVPKKKK